jgi:hypothetical protein
LATHPFSWATHPSSLTTPSQFFQSLEKVYFSVPDPHVFGPPGSGSTSQRYPMDPDPNLYFIKQKQ